MTQLRENLSQSKMFLKIRVLDKLKEQGRKLPAATDCPEVEYKTLLSLKKGHWQEGMALQGLGLKDDLTTW